MARLLLVCCFPLNKHQIQLNNMVLRIDFMGLIETKHLPKLSSRGPSCSSMGRAEPPPLQSVQ